MSGVEFWILLDNKLAFVTAELDDSLLRFLRRLRNYGGTAEYFPATLSYGACKFYRLKEPVPVFMDHDKSDAEDEDDNDNEEEPVSLMDTSDAVKQACLEKKNRARVKPGTYKIRWLADEISSDHVYLVIEFPDPFAKSNKAIGKLRQDHGTLFECLQVTVETLGKWLPSDVERNLQGGMLTDNDSGLPPEIREIQQALAKKRVYKVDDERERDCDNARSYQPKFNHIFTLGETESQTVISHRESAAFYHLLRCYDKDATKIKDPESSSALKAGNFTVHFIQPPFFSEDDSRSFKYHQEKLWSFPIFLRAGSAQTAWRKYTPRSDWMVISRSHEIPIVISEVISEKDESDRFRMLVQAIALARAGQSLLQSTSTRSFFVVAIYVDTDMVASRYLVMQTGRDNTEHSNSVYRDKAVCIHRKDFDLTDAEHEVDFLREMYNLTTEITALYGDLDQLKRGSLGAIKSGAINVFSLSLKHGKTKATGGTTLDSIAERNKWKDGPQDEDSLGVFDAEDIQNILGQMNYIIEFIPQEHPHLAMIVNKTGDKRGYLKFVKREKEVKILRYLTGIKSVTNHTITDVRFWPVEEGTVISMPVAGDWLTALDHPGEQLWSVALQLFEAIAFMHEHHVAHMDLKPQNILIPSEGGRLSIIDFSVSIWVRGPDATYSGVVGTEDYIAPEVHKGQYKPMLADLWSCGRTLEELCSYCPPSTDWTILAEIAERLMDPDPEARPKMCTVLEWMTTKHQGKDTQAVAPPMLG